MGGVRLFGAPRSAVCAYIIRGGSRLHDLADVSLAQAVGDGAHPADEEVAAPVDVGVGVVARDEEVLDEGVADDRVDPDDDEAEDGCQQHFHSLLRSEARPVRLSFAAAFAAKRT